MVLNTALAFSLICLKIGPRLPLNSMAFLAFLLSLVRIIKTYVYPYPMRKFGIVLKAFNLIRLLALKGFKPFFIRSVGM